MQIPNHTFFITGACSGLGKATAILLAEQEANIILADLNSKAGNELSEELGNQAIFITMDVTDPDAITMTTDKAKDEFGDIHGLVNCAGMLVAERLIKKDGSLFKLETYQQCLEINLIGSFNMIREVSSRMADNLANHDGETGIIINTASIAAYDGQIGQAAYAAAKAGIIGMTLPLARELGALGIRVMTIAPGIFATPMLAEIDPEKRLTLEQKIPFPQRLGKPSEYAALVKHIIENPMLNGEVIRLDGGLRMS